jgi:hypothetical protein
LFTPVPGKITVNGIKSDDIGTDLHKMFIARPNTLKALTAAQLVMSIAKDIPDNTVYVFQFAKATGLVIERTRTGAQMKARAKMVIAYHEAIKSFETKLAVLAGENKIVHADDPSKVTKTGKSSKGSVRGAGLVPSKMAPAKIAAEPVQPVVVAEPAAA